MRNSVFFILMGILLTALAVAAVSGETSSKLQIACPVTGNPIDKSIHLDYQGQRVYFCSSGCPAEFRKDPEKYFAKVAAAGVVLENIQTTCPVSGERFGGSDMGEPVTISYKGRTIKLCCKMCVAKFEKEPAKYLAKLPGEPVATK